MILHRVICCYPDADGLMDADAPMPASRWRSRSRGIRVDPAGSGMANVWFRMRRIGFRTYVHPLDAMLAIAGDRGFQVAQRQRGAVWQSLVLERA